ncbi:hypothetical protein [Mycobacteroides abscessus]|uniref:hypothetical protein n=1 Tax=Mycobacteroides abscessus TaxID=36809 RepID=UPI0010552E0D|nr:hypothetical protein [Mycobacteroides abscessus]
MITSIDELDAVTSKAALAFRYHQLNERTAILAVACGAGKAEVKTASGLEKDLRRKTPIDALANEVDTLATELEIEGLAGVIGPVGAHFDTLSSTIQAEVRAALLTSCSAARATAAYLLIQDGVREGIYKVKSASSPLDDLHSKLVKSRNDFISGRRRIAARLAEISKINTPRLEKRRLSEQVRRELRRQETEGQKVLQAVTDITEKLDRVHLEYASLAALHAHAQPKFRSSSAMRLPASTLGAKLRKAHRANPSRYPFPADAISVIAGIDTIVETKTRCKELEEVVRLLIHHTHIYDTKISQRLNQLDGH